MSKITDALRRAESERVDARGLIGGLGFTGDAQVREHESVEEIRWVEHAASPSESAPSPLRPPAPAAGWSVVTSTPSQALQSITTPGAVNGDPPLPPATVSTASWEQALVALTQQLGIVEQQAAQQAADQARVAAQLSALDQIVTQYEQERALLRTRLEQASKVKEAREAEKASLQRRLAALQECQVLAHEVRMAEQEAQASAAVIAQIVQSKQRLADELLRYQQRADALQQQVRELKVQLEQALASSGAAAPAPHDAMTRFA